MAEAIENAETQETGEKPVFSEEQQAFINEAFSKRISEVNAKEIKDPELAKVDEETRLMYLGSRFSSRWMGRIFVTSEVGRVLS